MGITSRWACLVIAAGALLILPQVAAAQAGPPPDTEFEKVTLNDRPGEPMDVAVLPDGRVLHATRRGQLWLHDPSTGINKLAATFNLYQHDEEGLQNVALDPNFMQNRWVYIFYSPPLNTPLDDPVTPVNEGDAPFSGTQADWDRYRGLIRLSRFKWRGERLDMGSEQQIIDVPVDRGICCHVGGDIKFDSQGNLYLSTGDDTNPFQSQGYTPIDERPERNPAFDAQRTSANTNDLRGKILRIRPLSGGGYAIPAGNMFPATALTRPEIYAMGFRNPFRIEINRENDDLYVADYSPDSRIDDPLRGPSGHGKWTIVREPGNYGWPYCATAELPYVDGEFVPGPSPSNPGFVSTGAAFDCANPVNESPNNTGLRELPAVQQPDVWYSYGLSAQFPELGSTPPGGIGPMGGPAYDFDPRTQEDHPTAWPAYFDGVPLFYEWTRDYIKEFRLDADGNLAEIRPATGSLLGTLGPARGDQATLDNGMDIEFGRDGSLYTLEYGDGFFSENADAQLARIDYIGPDGNHAPRVKVFANPARGLAPLTVAFSSAGTTDADGDRLRYAWDFTSDGRVDSRMANPTFTYRQDGVFRATLNVTDEHGRSAAEYVDIFVGNQPPIVDLTTTPRPGQPFHFGDTVQFQVNVTDEAPVDCSRVQVSYILGHDTHGHPLSMTAGCSGSIETTASGHNPAVDNITAVFVAEYTDPGGLEGSDQVVLRQTG
jgi:cytochrome c